jgi:predicted small lipoprotein YifL
MSFRALLRLSAAFGGLAFALAIAGCGVKGALEPPPTAQLAASTDADTTTEQKAAPTRPAGVQSERSEVQRVRQPGVLPSGTPEQWKTKRERAAKKGPSSKSEEPFVLDWLL